MPNIKEQEEKILDFINARLLYHINSLDDEEDEFVRSITGNKDSNISMGFSVDDFKQCECGREVFILILEKLKREGFIESVADEPDELYQCLNSIMNTYKKYGLDIPEHLKREPFSCGITVIPSKFVNKFNKQKDKKILKKIKIKFLDNGTLLEKNNNIIIHKYSEKDKAYAICKFFFVLKKGRLWHFWEDIYQEIQLDWSEEVKTNAYKHRGLETRAAMKKEERIGTRRDKKSISDSIRGINEHAIKEIGHEIIEADGQDRYKALF